MEQARVQEESQMKADHAKRLKAMRRQLEEEKRQRYEEMARLRRQLEIKQVEGACQKAHAERCLHISSLQLSRTAGVILSLPLCP